jgi:molecular chaperone GrpE
MGETTLNRSPEDARPASEIKVVDRRWWARGESAGTAESPATSKPTYVEELEARLAEKDRILQTYVEQYKNATSEFDAARARSRREVAREVERGKRAILVDLLDVVDNLDRAIESAQGTPSVDGLLHGVEMVRRQFLSRLEGYGISEIQALDQPFDPQLHEAVSVVTTSGDEAEDRVVGIVRRGYRIGDEILRPALVAVAKRS